MTVLTAEPRTLRGERREHAVATATVSLLSVAGAAIHFYVAPSHLTEWWVYGWFLLLIGVGQLATVPVVLRWRSPALLSAAVAGNVAVVLIWVVSRTNGLPIGPPVLDMTGGRADPTRGGYGAHAVGLPEPIGVLDLTATVCELLIVVALCSMLPAAWRRRAFNAILVVGASVWVLFALGVLA